MPRKSVVERRKQIKAKTKEVRQLRKENIRSVWREKRVAFWVAAPRFMIAVVLLVCFIIHATTTPLSNVSSMVDRTLVPMALGGDMLLQVGLFVAAIAFTFVHPATILIVDSTALLLLVILLFVALPRADFLFAAVIVMFIFEVIAIALHIYMLFQETNRLKRIKKAVRESPRFPRQESRGSSFYPYGSSSSRGESVGPGKPPTMRESKKLSKSSPAKTFAKRMEEEEKKQRKTQSMSTPAKRFKEKAERESSSSKADRNSRGVSINPKAKSTPISPPKTSVNPSPKGSPTKGSPKGSPPRTSNKGSIPGGVAKKPPEHKEADKPHKPPPKASSATDAGQHARKPTAQSIAKTPSPTKPSVSVPARGTRR